MKNRIRELRIEEGLRQKDLAEKLGISAQSLSYYENWVNKPDPEMLIKLADFFEVSVDYLLCRENEYGVIVKGHNLTADELKLLEDYRELSENMQHTVLSTVELWKKAK